MDMFRQDLQTVLFILSPLEALRPFPVPSFPEHATYHQSRAVTFYRQFFALPPGGHLLERVTGGGTGFRHF